VTRIHPFPLGHPDRRLVGAVLVTRGDARRLARVYRLMRRAGVDAVDARVHLFILLNVGRRSVAS
jgi:hypothetical protein